MNKEGHRFQANTCFVLIIFFTYNNKLQCTFGYYIVLLYFGKKYSQYFLLITDGN